MVALSPYPPEPEAACLGCTDSVVAFLGRAAEVVIGGFMCALCLQLPRVHRARCGQQSHPLLPPPLRLETSLLARAGQKIRRGPCGISRFLPSSRLVCWHIRAPTPHRQPRSPSHLGSTATPPRPRLPAAGPKVLGQVRPSNRPAAARAAVRRSLGCTPPSGPGVTPRHPLEKNVTRAHADIRFPMNH